MARYRDNWSSHNNMSRDIMSPCQTTRADGDKPPNTSGDKTPSTSGDKSKKTPSTSGDKSKKMPSTSGDKSKKMPSTSGSQPEETPSTNKNHQVLQTITTFKVAVEITETTSVSQSDSQVSGMSNKSTTDKVNPPDVPGTGPRTKLP